MNVLMEEHWPKNKFKLPIKILVPLLALVVVATWLAYTPAGLLGKADAVGYAVCHRIASHSFFFGDRQLPLCARCSGMHLGTLLGLVFQLRLGKRGGMPAKKFLVLFGIALLIFAFDGTNSYLTLVHETGTGFDFLTRISPLYTPVNWLRTLTGIFLGLGIAGILYPVFNQTMWVNWKEKPALFSWGQLFQLILLGGAVELAVLSNNVLILYPLALLSAANVLIVLAVIYSIAWTMITKRENQFRQLKEIWVILLAGFATAILQIAVMNYGRFLLTGTWEGFFASVSNLI